MNKEKFKEIAETLYQEMGGDNKASVLILGTDGKEGYTFLQGNPGAIMISLSVSIEDNTTIKDIVALAAKKNELENYTPSEETFDTVLRYAMRKLSSNNKETIS